MRLLDAEALIYDDVAELMDFTDESSAPPYAILSHTWEEEEVLFADIPLGPQHEIVPSAVATRARQRRQAMSLDSLKSDTDDDTDTATSDTNTSEDSDAGISYASQSDKSLSNSQSSGRDNGLLNSSNSVRSTSMNGTSDRANVVYPRKVESRSIPPHVKAGWNKILNACLQTIRDGLAYIWIDTCCIDKSSSAELSEAINSMYRWYEHALVCYAYLSDCPGCPEFQGAIADFPYSAYNPNLISKDQSAIIRGCIEDCRWFTRGWTLQELIAPEDVRFFDRRWHQFARRDDISGVLENITGIHTEVLLSRYIVSSRSKGRFSVAQRMFWASNRETTRKEDEAYSLLGLFDVNMPLLYGEGARAFERLQQEIIRNSTDHSILAWDYPEGRFSDGLSNMYTRPPLAPSASYFGGRARNIITKSRNYEGNLRLTNEGLEMTTGLEAYRVEHEFLSVIAILECAFQPLETTVGVWIRIDLDNAADLRKKASTRRLRGRFTADTELKTRLVELDDFELYGGRTYKMLFDWMVVALWGGLYQYGWKDQLAPKINIMVGQGNPQWHIVGSYPPDYLKALGSMILATENEACGAVAVRNRVSGEQFAVMVSVARAGLRIIGKTKWNYWLMPMDPRSADFWDRPTLLGQLKKLCERVNNFKSLDYFERSTKRLKSCKSLHLLTGERVTAGFANKWFPTSWNHDMELVLHIEHDTDEKPSNLRSSMRDDQRQ